MVVSECPLKLTGTPDHRNTIHDFHGYQDCQNNGVTTSKEASIRGEMIGQVNGKLMFAVKHLLVH